MSLLTVPSGTVRDSATVMGRINPVAKLATIFAITFPLIFTIDWVSATVALALELVLFLWAGLTVSTFLRRTAMVWIAAPLTGLTILLYGQTSGEIYFHFLLIEVSQGSVELAIATVLRVLAIALPSVVLFLTIDPTDLADGLAQVLKLPARFVLGALAALRLVGLFLDDWRSLELARRARGVADDGKLRRFLGQAFALLVLSIRRGSKLATAMEARAFGSDTRRSWARASVFRWREWVLIAIGVAIAATAVIISVTTGNWNFIGTPNA